MRVKIDSKGIEKREEVIRALGEVVVPLSTMNYSAFVINQRSRKVDSDKGMMMLDSRFGTISRLNFADHGIVVHTNIYLSRVITNFSHQVQSNMSTLELRINNLQKEFGRIGLPINTEIVPQDNYFFSGYHRDWEVDNNVEPLTQDERDNLGIPSAWRASTNQFMSPSISRLWLSLLVYVTPATETFVNQNRIYWRKVENGGRV